jgi:hypothetical protein
MTDQPPVASCSYRYIHLGRTFCSVAIRERRYTTAQVVPDACRSCQARKVISKHACGHMDVGIEVDEYHGTLNVEMFYASCGVTVERLFEFDGCGEGKCQHWIPPDPGELERIRAEAKARHLASEKTD